jgi:effector-binding domain-containing protein
MKKALYVIIGLLVVYLVLCLVGPKVSHIERTTTVNQKPEMVKAQLVDLKFFNEKWSPWTKKDSKMKITYSGEVGKPGYKYDWEGNPDSVGTGSMEFSGISGDTIKQKLVFKNWNMSSDVYLVTVPEGEGTKVTWGLTMPMGFMWRGMGLFMSPEKMMGKDFDEGIASMKKSLEAVSATPAYNVQEKDWEAKTFVGKKGVFKFVELPKFFAETYPKLMGELAANKIETTGAPSAIYFKYDEIKMETECAAIFCLKEKKAVKGWETWNIPAGKVLLIEYYGAYDKSAAAHMAMDAYMKEKGLSQSMVIEEYVTDPMNEKDTAKWLTNIVYVLK